MTDDGGREREIGDHPLRDPPQFKSRAPRRALFPLPDAAMMPPGPSGQDRFDFVDAARAFAAVAMIVGSMLPRPSFAAAALSAAGLPLFVWLSGFLWSRRRLRASLSELAAHLAISLLRPYAVLFAASWGLWIVVHGITDGVEWFDPRDMIGPFLGFLHGGAMLDRVNPVLWALPATFVAMIGYRMAHGAIARAGLPTGLRLDEHGVALAVAVVVGAVLAAMQWRPGSTPDWWPWDPALVPSLLLAFAAGQWSRHWREASGALSAFGADRRSALVVVPAFGALWAASAWVAAPADFTHGDAGARPLAFAVAGIAAASCVARLAVWVPAGAVVRWVADHALPLVALQATFAVSLQGLVQLVPGYDPSATRLSGWPLTTALAAFATVLAVLAVRGAQVVREAREPDEQHADGFVGASVGDGLRGREAVEVSPLDAVDPRLDPTRSRPLRSGGGSDTH